MIIIQYARNKFVYSVVCFSVTVGCRAQQYTAESDTAAEDISRSTPLLSWSLMDILYVDEAGQLC